MADSTGKRLDNHLLDSLSDAALARLAPFLTSSSHKVDEMLYDMRERVKFVYFPTSCVVSQLMIMENGDMIEVATVGPEGVVGHSALSEAEAVNRVVVQIPGDSLRMGLANLQRAVDQDFELEDLFGRYHRAHTYQVSRSVACNGLHKVEQRCCRWLLMTRDRVGSNSFSLTHEYLSYMLGVRRATVSDVLAPLQAEGLLRSERGAISILSHEGLEQRACECYKAVRDEYKARLGWSP